MNTVPSVPIVNNQIGAVAPIRLRRLLNYICQKCGAYLTAALNRAAALNRSFTVTSNKEPNEFIKNGEETL